MIKKFLMAIGLFAAAEGTSTAQTIYDYKMTDIDGKEQSLSQYKGKVVMIINVASKCGFTHQYADIEALYLKYKDRGLVVLGFPANNFMGQEPGTSEEIKSFCSTKFNVTFPMFTKISVKGKDIHPLYQYLTDKAKNGKVDSSVKWNFQKFLVNRAGHVIESFAPPTNVTNEDLISAVEKALAEK
jgi:glutathione peroxidase-family protein